MSASATTAPSAFETALCAIAITCPSCRTRAGRSAVIAAAISSARSSPAPTSGRRLIALAERLATMPGCSAGVGDGQDVRAFVLAEHGACAGRSRTLTAKALAQRREIGAGVDVEQQRGWSLEPECDARAPRERLVALA